MDSTTARPQGPASGCRRPTVAIAAVGVALLLAACGGAGAARRGAAPRTVELAASDQFRFTPVELRVTAGQQVTVRLQNTGVLVHDFVTRGQGVDGKLQAAPGQTATGAFTAAAQPGRYEFVCIQPGHEQAGMKGTLIVE